MSRITGLEVLFSIIKSNLKSKEDCAVAAIHCILLNSDLLCVGVGEVFSDNDADTATELLPENWNASQDVYSLRYRSKDLKKCYLLKISKAGSNLHIDFGKNEDSLVTTTVNTKEYVSDDFSSFPRTFKKLDELKSQVYENVVKAVEAQEKSNSSQKKESSKTSDTTPKNGPNSKVSEVDYPQPIPRGPSDLLRSGSERYAYPVVGASDLDPLGRSQGGMFFDPFSGSSRSPFGGPGLGPFGGSRGGRFGGGTDLPPGAVPPGARFDPFSPITPGRFNPDPDHFKSDYNNMFM